MAKVNHLKYAEFRKTLSDFLLNFKEQRCPVGQQYKYTRALQAIHSGQGRALVIELDDLISYFKGPVAAASTYFHNHLFK